MRVAGVVVGAARLSRYLPPLRKLLDVSLSAVMIQTCPVFLFEAPKISSCGNIHANALVLCFLLVRAICNKVTLWDGHAESTARLLESLECHHRPCGSGRPREPLSAPLMAYCAGCRTSGLTVPLRTLTSGAWSFGATCTTH